MLKRQRPATPPPVSFDASPCCPGRSFRPPASLSEHCTKRRRVALAGRHEGSDGEDDWVGDGDGDGDAGQSCHADMDYKRPNCLLHELHVLHQHRLMFAPGSTPDVPSPPICAHPSGHGNADATSVFPQPPPGKSPIPESPLVSVPAWVGQPHSDQEAQSVWEHYEGTNRSSPFPYPGRAPCAETRFVQASRFVVPLS